MVSLLRNNQTPGNAQRQKGGMRDHLLERRHIQVELRQIKKTIMDIKCITFDKQAQDALPEEIKAKMKADRKKAIMDRQLKEMDALNKKQNQNEKRNKI